MANKNSTDIQVKDLDGWALGQVSYFSKSRLQETALANAVNVMIDYNGVVRPRGSFVVTGIPDLPAGSIPLCQDFAFNRGDGTQGLAVVASDGTHAYLYVLKADLSDWTKLATVFDKDAKMSLDQIDGVVVLGNGIDLFSYYDIASETLKQLVAVADPTVAPAATPSGFSGTNTVDYYYAVAFEGVGGTTKMTPGVKVSSSDVRSNWVSSGKNVSVDITSLTLDPNAVGWQVCVASVPYGSGAPSAGEYLRIAEGLSTSQKKYIDDGSVSFLIGGAPVENSTAGIKGLYFKNIAGRLWAIGSDGIVYWGGDSESGKALYFGTANGAGSYSIDKGGIEVPMAVTLGRDNSGTTCINLLTKTTAGQGAIWDIYATTNTLSFNDSNVSVATYQFKKREGNDGTDAPFSVLWENNNVYYLSMLGFKSTGVKPNITGIQATDIISSAIKDKVLNLDPASLANCYVAYYNQCVYWSVAYGTDKNNQIWVYDVLHGGIWTIWDIPADSVFRWGDVNSDKPSLYIRQGNRLLVYQPYSHSHTDAGEPFTAYIESGLIPFKDDRIIWVHLLKILWQFDNAIGELGIKVKLHDKNGGIVKQSSAMLSPAATSVAGGWDSLYGDYGWGARPWDESLLNFSNVDLVLDRKVDQRIRKNVSYISFTVTSNTENTYYELSHISLLFTYIGEGIEFLSRKGVIKI